MAPSLRPLPHLTQGFLVLSGDRYFRSIQGEGVFLGCPAVFLRLHMCNLSCAWCDTRYTWDRTLPQYRDEYSVTSISALTEEIGGLPERRLVITGGEPLLQMNEVEELIAGLSGWNIEIETNGTIAPSLSLRAVTVQGRCHFNVSPKLKNSHVRERLRSRPTVLRQFAELPNVTFKFVVGSEQDLDEIATLTGIVGVPDNRVVISPEATDEQTMLRISRELVGAVASRGWRLLPRWHVLLWGSRRRV